jgi:spore coat polysaccharide biosynthesis predicted glycosyltransferase SpsG
MKAVFITESSYEIGLGHLRRCFALACEFEKDKDSHGIEIAHTLRYAAGHILAYAVHVCVGPEKAKEIINTQIYKY